MLQMKPSHQHSLQRLHNKSSPSRILFARRAGDPIIITTSSTHACHLHIVLVPFDTLHDLHILFAGRHRFRAVTMLLLRNSYLQVTECIHLTPQGHRNHTARRRRKMVLDTVGVLTR